MDIAAYVSGITQNITDQTIYESVSQVIVGNGFTDLAYLTKNAVESGLTGSTVFNGNRPITAPIDNIENVTPGGTDVVTFLNNVFYPPVAPFATISIPNLVREVGSSTAYVITWSVTANTNPITSIYVDGNFISPTGGNQNGVSSGNTAMASGNYIKTVSVSDGSLTTNESETIEFLYNIFYGNTSSVPTTSADIRALSNNFNYGTVFTLNTGTINSVYVIAVYNTHTLQTVIDLDALNLDLTNQFSLTNFNVNDASSNPVLYNIYIMNSAIPYTSNHRFQVLIN